MYNLKDCFNFKAGVEESDGKYHVCVLGIGYDKEDDFEYSVLKSKKFDTKEDCMIFLSKILKKDYDYRFVVDDFIFVSNRYFSFDYFRCGVDFDED